MKLYYIAIINTHTVTGLTYTHVGVVDSVAIHV